MNLAKLPVLIVVTIELLQFGVGKTERIDQFHLCTFVYYRNFSNVHTVLIFVRISNRIVAF